MKDSGAPEVGDLVYHNHDISRKIPCPGLVIGTRGVECLVLWSSESAPQCWHKRNTLKIVQSKQGQTFDISLTEYD